MDGFDLREAFEDEWQELLEEDSGDERDRDGDVPEPGFPEPEREREPLELAVVEKPLRDGLFGFTRRGSSHVVVNRNLYRVDRERTIRHEKTHHLHPKGETTIRYINGDPDVRNTLSFQGNNPARLGRGSRGITRGGAAAYGSGKGASSYRRDRSDGYI